KPHRIVPRDRLLPERFTNGIPQLPGRGSELLSFHSIESARPLGSRRDPPTVAEHLEVPAHGGLRQLQRGSELAHRELSRLEREEQPSPRGLGQRAEVVEDSGSGRIHSSIRIEGWMLSG